MDGIHDMGGSHDFPACLTERDEAVFHAEWEARAFVLSNAYTGAGCANVDQFRHAIERLDPAAYIGDGYFGRWLGSIELMIADANDQVTPGRYSDHSAAREIDAVPRFGVGDIVRTKNHNPPGHTRLPGYVRNRTGRVELLHGGWVYPDTHAHHEGENPEHVYSVRFDGDELWGADAEPGTSVTVDLFESYLEPA